MSCFLSPSSTLPSSPPTTPPCPLPLNSVDRIPAAWAATTPGAHPAPLMVRNKLAKLRRSTFGHFVQHKTVFMSSTMISNPMTFTWMWCTANKAFPAVSKISRVLDQSRILEMQENAIPFLGFLFSSITCSIYMRWDTWLHLKEDIFSEVSSVSSNLSKKST